MDIGVGVTNAKKMTAACQPFEEVTTLTPSLFFIQSDSVLDPRKCEYLKDYSLDFEHAYMTTYLAS